MSAFDPEILASLAARRAHAYWSGLRQDARLPARRDVSPPDIPELIPDLVLMDIDHGAAPSRFRFRLAGTRFCRLYGEEITGRYLDEVVAHAAWSEYWHQQCRAVASGEIRHGVDRIIWNDRQHMRFEWLHLPLAEDGETPDMILSIVVFETSMTGEEKARLDQVDCYDVAMAAARG